MSPSPKHAIPKDLLALLQRESVRIGQHREIPHGTQYDLSKAHETSKLNVYHTGKVSTGGRASGLKALLEGWRISRPGTKRGGKPARPVAVRASSEPVLDGRARVGVDESGKGDYFGPLVVAGVRVAGMEVAQKLRKIGVRDSKDLSVGGARRMATLILEAVGEENMRVVVLSPREYEERRSAAGNVNKLLGEIDARIVAELAVEVEMVVVDQFAPAARSYVASSVPAGVRLEVRPRAEDDAAVAAASIVARARQLEEMERLSEKVGTRLPLGATHVVGAGRRVYGERGWEGLKDVAKVSFRTTEKVRGGR